MELDYFCHTTQNMNPACWKGHMKLLRQEDPYELEVTSRGSNFHILCGKHRYGNFICIPNWDIGTELGALDDSFWNLEHLTMHYPKLSLVDAISITHALVKLNEYLSSSEEAG